MTDPLKLATALESANSRLEKPGDVRFFTFEIDTAYCALVAAALRLAEARFALDAHEDDEPTEGLIGEWTLWSDEREVLHRRVVDAAMNYELARRGDERRNGSAPR